MYLRLYLYIYVYPSWLFFSAMFDCSITVDNYFVCTDNVILSHLNILNKNAILISNIFYSIIIL